MGEAPVGSISSFVLGSDPDYKKLKADHPSCASIYVDKGFRYEPSIGALEKDGIGAFVDELRKKL